MLPDNPFSSIVQVDQPHELRRQQLLKLTELFRQGLRRRYYRWRTEVSRRRIGKLLLGRFCSLLEGKIRPCQQIFVERLSNLMIEEVAMLLREKEEISIRYRQLLQEWEASELKARELEEELNEHYTMVDVFNKKLRVLTMKVFTKALSKPIYIQMLHSMDEIVNTAFAVSALSIIDQLEQ